MTRRVNATLSFDTVWSTSARVVQWQMQNNGVSTISVCGTCGHSRTTPDRHKRMRDTPPTATRSPMPPSGAWPP